MHSAELSVPGFGNKLKASREAEGRQRRVTYLIEGGTACYAKLYGINGREGVEEN